MAYTQLSFYDRFYKGPERKKPAGALTSGLCVVYYMLHELKTEDH